MHIDIIDQLGKVSGHPGAKVPYVKFDKFKELRFGKEAGTPDEVGEIELTSDDVLAVFANPSKPDIKKEAISLQPSKKKLLM